MTVKRVTRLPTIVDNKLRDLILLIDTIAIAAVGKKVEAVAAPKRSDIVDFWDAPFWPSIPDKPTAYPPSGHTHPRVDITDLWDTPFWDNIPDKPSTYPPDPHIHPRVDITDFWGTPFWDNIPDKPSTYPPDPHLHDTGDVTTGRFVMPRMPDGISGQLLMATGINSDPIYTDPIVTVADVTKVTLPADIQATASGTTQVIAAPGSGSKLRVKFIKVWNSGTADITVDLRFTAGGTARFRATLAAKTGFAFNLIAANWEGGDNQGLFINLSAAGTVDVTALYTLEAV